MEQFKGGDLDTLYFDDFGRATRSGIESYRLAKLMERLRMRLIGVSDGFDLVSPAAEIRVAAAGMFNSWFIRQLREKVIRGMKGAARRGTSTGKPRFGYRLVPMRDADGQVVVPAEDVEKVNEAQRVILIAEDYDYEVLVTAEWLHEKHGVDVRCYRLPVSTDGPSEYASCTCIYPPRELADHAVQRGRGPAQPMKWGDWEAALQQVANPAVVSYFKKELAAGRDSHLRKRILRYKLDGRRRWWVSARRDAAYVWQDGRFDGDEAFWATRLGPEADAIPVKRGTCLRFFLSTTAQFEAFAKAVATEAKGASFAVGVEAGEEEDGE